MSVFRVKLNNTQQGLMDQNPATGAQFATSIQRTFYVTGPGRSYRELFDGQTFTDCNYWKKFAYPQVPLDQAFIEVVSDDGSVYSDIPQENTFPRVYDSTLAGGSTYTDTGNIIDVVGDNGAPAVSASIENTSSQAVKVKLNGLATAIFDLDGNTAKTFNLGDAVISYIQFWNASSGATTATVQTILTIRSKPTS
jgi:hypothetical protein